MFVDITLGSATRAATNDYYHYGRYSILYDIKQRHPGSLQTENTISAMLCITVYYNDSSIIKIDLVID